MAAVNYGYFYVDAQDTSHPNSQKLATTSASNWSSKNYNWNGSGYASNIVMDSNYNLVSPTGLLKYVYRHTEDYKGNNHHGKERFLCEAALQIAIKSDYSAFRLRLIVTNPSAYYYGYIKFGYTINNGTAPSSASALPYGGTTPYTINDGSYSNGSVLAESGNISLSHTVGTATVIHIYSYCHQTACYSLGTNSLSAAPTPVADIYIKESQSNPKNLSASVTDVTGKSITVTANWTAGTGNVYERCQVSVYSDSNRTNLVYMNRISTSGDSIILSSSNMKNNTYYYLKFELLCEKQGASSETIVETKGTDYVKTYGMTLLQTECIPGTSVGAMTPATLKFKASEIVGIINGVSQRSKYKYWQSYALRNTFTPTVSSLNVYSKASTSSTVVGTLTNTGMTNHFFSIISTNISETWGNIYYDSTNGTRKEGWIQLSNTNYFGSVSNPWSKISTSISSQISHSSHYNDSSGSTMLEIYLESPYKIIASLFSDAGSSTITSTISDVSTSIVTAAYDTIEYQDIEIYSCTGKSITCKVKYKDSDWTKDTTNIYLATDSGESATYSRACNNGGNIEALLTINNLENGVNYTITGTIGTDNIGNLPVRIYITAKTYGLTISDIETSSKALKFKLSLDKGTINRNSSGTVTSSYAYSVNETNLETGLSGTARTGTIKEGESDTLIFTNIRNYMEFDRLLISYEITTSVLNDVEGSVDAHLKNIYFYILDTTDGCGYTIGQNSVVFKFKLYLEDILGDFTLMSNLKDPIADTSYVWIGSTGSGACPAGDPYVENGYNTDSTNHPPIFGIDRNNGILTVTFYDLKSWCWYLFYITISDGAGTDSSTGYPFNSLKEMTKLHTDYPYIRIYKDGEWKKCMAFIYDDDTKKFRTAITNIHNGTKWKEIDGQ